jgi:hypothetical protein
MKQRTKDRLTMSAILFATGLISTMVWIGGKEAAKYVCHASFSAKEARFADVNHDSTNELIVGNYFWKDTLYLSKDGSYKPFSEVHRESTELRR